MQSKSMESDSTRKLPSVLLIGGDDVHARIELMRGLEGDYTLAAAGTARELAARFESSGLPYYYYPLGRAVGPASDVRAFVALWRLLKRLRPHIVHAFDTKPGVYGCLAARLAGVPVVLGTITGLGSLYGEDGWRSRIVRATYEKLQRLTSQCSDMTVFQNKDDRAEFLARRIVSVDKARLIAGSGVPTDVLDPARVSDTQRLAVRESLAIPQDSPLVTMVARVIRSKGVEEFVAAAGLVRSRLPKARFLLVGPADKDSVDSFGAAELAGFAKAVCWPGARNDIPHILAASDLFVLPSYLREGIPRALLEAAAMGLPLITTNSPGCNDVVEDGVNGCLTPARDPQALSQAIVNLLDQPDVRERFGCASRLRAVERFDLAVVVKQTRMLYDQLRARKFPAAAARKEMARNDEVPSESLDDRSRPVESPRQTPRHAGGGVYSALLASRQ